MALDELTRDPVSSVRQVLFTEQQIHERISALATEISRDYAGREPILIGVLKGVFVFMADLARRLTIPLEIDFMAVSSYSGATRDRGMVRIIKDLDCSITGRDVLFVEDVVDTGLTLNYLLRNLRSRGPASIEVCALFDKPGRRLIGLPIAYRGFKIPDKFIVGYGLDHREHHRNLPYVGLLKPDQLHPERDSGQAG